MAAMNRFSDMLGMSARQWHLVDARHQVVGKLAIQLTLLLRGKWKPTFARGIDVGDHVVVINTEDVDFTRDQWQTKKYHWHTLYAGGFHTVKAKELHRKNPTEVLYRAVYGSLPKNETRHVFMKRLHLFPDSRHPYRENISFSIAGPSVQFKKLADYTDADILNVPVVVEPEKFVSRPKDKALMPQLHAQYKRNLPKTLSAWKKMKAAAGETGEEAVDALPQNLHE